VIGSDETPASAAKLTDLSATLGAGVKGEPLPWAYGLAVGQMGLDPAKVAYFSENAFSLGYARDVWTIRPGGPKDDLELFLIARSNKGDARKLAKRLQAAFLEFGEPGGRLGDMALAKDSFLSTLSGVTARDRFVLGVRGATDRDVVAKEVARLGDALAAAPADLLARAQPDAQRLEKSSGKSSKAGGDGEH
jgi:hypothetical protein